MAYLFGAANTDRIAVSGLSLWTTQFTVAARLKLTAADTSQRGIFYPQQFFFDFSTGATNEARGGFQDSDSQFQLATWTSGFVAGDQHTLIGNFSTGVGEMQLRADTDPAPKGTPASGILGPLSTGTTGIIGGDGVTLSLAGTLYELAYWHNTRLTGAECAVLGGGGPITGITLPTHYWPLISDANDLYGGAHGTVTGASNVAHSGTNWFSIASAPTSRANSLLIGVA